MAGEDHALAVLRDEGLHWEGANRFAVAVDCEISGGWGGGAPIEEGVEDGLCSALAIEGEVGAGAWRVRCRECGDLEGFAEAWDGGGGVEPVARHFGREFDWARLG